MAHSTATREAAQQRVSLVHNHLAAQPGEDTVAAFWAEQLAAVANAPKGGTLKQWMTDAHDEIVDTFQVTLRSGEGDAWFITEFFTPGPRRVDAARATRVLLNGSERSYDGVTTHLMTEHVYVGFAAWGNDAVHMVVYSR